MLVVAGAVASATVPRWWAHRVGDQVNESITSGVLIGLFYGFVFTLLPIALLTTVLRWRRRWATVGIALVAALVLALPNLMTLGIVVGRSNAAHAGQRTLDVQAPAFRGASLAGVLLAVGFAAMVIHLIASRKRARSDARHARDELIASTSNPTPPQPESSNR
ncbi:permease [Gaiella sp.]|uniref:permease n=1 Tax=Gaiella sp. TaxID=2663207 RepID=UPI0032662092